MEVGGCYYSPFFACPLRKVRFLVFSVFSVFLAVGPGTFLPTIYALSGRRGSWQLSHPWFGTLVGTTVAGCWFFFDSFGFRRRRS